jgi:hypothetical protein
MSRIIILGATAIGHAALQVVDKALQHEQTLFVIEPEPFIIKAPPKLEPCNASYYVEETQKRPWERKFKRR